MHDAPSVAVTDPIRTAPTARQQGLRRFHWALLGPIELPSSRASLDLGALIHNPTHARCLIEYGRLSRVAPHNEAGGLNGQPETNHQWKSAREGVVAAGAPLRIIRRQRATVHEAARWVSL